MARVAPCFARWETRLTCKDMVHGLLSELEDRNCWTLAEAAGHDRPYRMQHLLSRARCDEQRMLDTAGCWAAGRLSAGQDQDGGNVVLIVDETADEKSSDGCAGASHQYSGTVGGTTLCQVAVTLTYAAPAGHALIGRALYLPEAWAADEERRELAGVPGEVTFKTKPQLAAGLLQPAARTARHQTAAASRNPRHHSDTSTASTELCLTDPAGWDQGSRRSPRGGGDLLACSRG